MSPGKSVTEGFSRGKSRGVATGCAKTPPGEEKEFQLKFNDIALLDHEPF